MALFRYFFLSVVVLVFVTGCGWSKVEVQRVASPSGELEAVVIEEDGGATTSKGYAVYIVERGNAELGDHCAYIYGARLSENDYGISIEWSAEDHLEIHFIRAKFVEYEESIIVGDRLVEISLNGEVMDRDTNE